MFENTKEKINALLQNYEFFEFSENFSSENSIGDFVDKGKDLLDEGITFVHHYVEAAPSYCKQLQDLTDIYTLKETMQIGSIYFESEYYARTKFYSDEDKENAFRHCFGTCSASQSLGEKAQLSYDLHERYSPEGESCDSAIDVYNNKIGSSWGLNNPNGDCYSFCEKSMEEGALVLYPGREKSAYNEVVFNECSSQ